MKPKYTRRELGVVAAGFGLAGGMTGALTSVVEAATSGNRPHPTSLGLTTSLVEGGALMSNSSSSTTRTFQGPVKSSSESTSASFRGRLLYPLIPKTFATVSVSSSTLRRDVYLSYRRTTCAVSSPAYSLNHSASGGPSARHAVARSLLEAGGSDLL